MTGFGAKRPNTSIRAKTHTGPTHGTTTGSVGTRVNDQFAAIFALLVLLSSCAGQTGPGVMGLPPNPHRGAPRALLHVLQPLIRGQHHRIEFALLGSPRYESLRNPVAYRFSVLANWKIYQEISLVNPQVSRYFVWVIPARVTREIRNDYITVRVEVCRLARYTYSGTPLLSEPFTQHTIRVLVSHPVAGGQFGYSETPYFVL